MLSLILALVILAAFLYVVNAVVPGPAWIKTVINVVAAVVVLVWLLDALGFPTGVGHRLCP